MTPALVVYFAGLAMTIMITYVSAKWAKLKACFDGWNLFSKQMPTFCSGF